MPAKIRSVKPEFFQHDELFDLERESGLPIRLAYVGLWTQCDREGRFEWKPRFLKLQILPYDDVDFAAVLDALQSRGFVARYDVDGRCFGVVPSFTRHQLINNRESDSKIPAPPDADACLTRAPRVNDASSTRDGRDGHATQSCTSGSGSGTGSGTGSGGKRVADDATPTPQKRGRFTPPTIDEVSTYCQERLNQVNPEKFHAHYESIGWMVGRTTMKDWRAAVRKWEQDDQHQPRQNGHGSLSFAGIEAFVAAGGDDHEPN